MAKIGVSLKINVSEIEKARLFAGKKGKYLDATVFIDINDFDQYGNSGMITQDVTKEEKDNGVKGNILGNCKVFWNDSAPEQQGNWGQQKPAPQPAPAGNYQQAQANHAQQQAPQQQSAPKFNEPPMDFDDDIPFIHYANLGHAHLVI